jgi:hypothetical protein
MTGIGTKHCRVGRGRKGKDDRKQNTLAPLILAVQEKIPSTASELMVFFYYCCFMAGSLKTE